MIWDQTWLNCACSPEKTFPKKLLRQLMTSQRQFFAKNSQKYSFKATPPAIRVSWINTKFCTDIPNICCLKNDFFKYLNYFLAQITGRSVKSLLKMPFFGFFLTSWATGKSNLRKNWIANYNDQVIFVSLFLGIWYAEYVQNLASDIRLWGAQVSSISKWQWSNQIETSHVA